MSGYPETTRKIIARALVVLLAFILGINGFGLYGPRVSADAGADLIVQNITLSPQDPTIDDTVTITVAVKNQGTVSAGLNNVTCYMDSVILDTRTISSLAAGITTSVAFTWTAQKGSHSVKAIADSGGAITETDETNNIKIFNFSTLAPDLIVQSVSWSPQNPSKGDNVVFSVIIQNQGNTKSSLTNTILYVDGVSKGSQNIDAINPGSTATKTFSWIASAGQHTIRVTVDEENYVKESDETNNEQSFPFSTMAPDLIITSISWTPQSPTRNDRVTFIATVKNQGTGRSDACHLGYYIDDVFVSVISVNALEAGASSYITITWTALPDVHHLKVVIDYYQVVVESDETNNERTVTLSTVVPDLIIKDITWTPQNAGVGDNVTFTVVIKNQGGGDATASRASYYINGTYKGYLSVPALAAGAETTGTFTYTAEYGTITVNVAVDLVLGETHGENNSLTKTVPIVQADLKITNVTWAPVNPAVGDTVTFTITVKNQDGGRASNYNVGYYIDDVFVGSDLVYATASGASANTAFEWQAQNGRHIFKAVADYTNLVIESNEKNNDFSVTVIPFMPDLIIGTVTWTPQDAPAGSEVTFDISVQNIGTFHAGTSRLTYYVDGAVAGFDYLGSVDPGASVTEHFTWVATAGSHTINIVADANNQVLEIDETNNTKVVSLPPPDLAVQNITVSPPDAAIGDTVVITATINNRGSSKTEKSLVTLYIDGTLIVSHDLPPINAGSSADASFNWITEAGTHTIKIVADINNTVIESDEVNNDKDIQFAILTPDLVVQDFHWDTNNQLASNEINFTVTVKNTGTGEAGDSKLEYYFEDTPALTKDIPPIPAGQTAELSFTSILSPGSHTAYIVVDSANDVAELNEDNNSSTFPISTVVPDLVVRTVTWSPLDAKIGDKITITAKVENQGIAKATFARTTLFIDGTEAGYVDTPEIDADSTATADFPWTVTAGPHEISVLANSNNTVLESNLTNNAKSRSISFENPTLPVKKSASLPVVPLKDKGFLNSWWWLLLLVAGVLGVGAFTAALRAAKKKY